MSTTAAWGRYTEVRPPALEAIRAITPVAYLPWGGLSWHGPHLPLGLDTIVAEATAERAIRRTGGVLLPPLTWPLATPHHRDSLGLSAATLRALLADSLAALAQGGWRVAVLISGHYSPGHELLLIEAAEAAISRHGLLTLAIPPLALVDEEMLDHAALWESSVLLALRPDLVDLNALGAGPLDPSSSAVVGRDPRETASPSLGLSVLSIAIERICSAVEALLATGDPAPLQTLYERRRERYRSFVARYGADPEAATAAWWQELIGGAPR
ncbi:MAG: creatininase family protein [Chloroflexi bacterium]|nr:creatininase family protein [Chloroflexota bacterium]